MRYAVIVAALLGVGLLARFYAKDGHPDSVSDKRPAYDECGARLESVMSERDRYRAEASSLEDDLRRAKSQISDLESEVSDLETKVRNLD